MSVLQESQVVSDRHMVSLEKLVTYQKHVIDRHEKRLVHLESLLTLPVRSQSAKYDVVDLGDSDSVQKVKGNYNVIKYFV